MDIWFRVNDPKFIPGVATDIDSDDYLRKTLQDMKQILINADVYPPFCPEFQFRDHVKAKRVEQDKVQT